MPANAWRWVRPAHHGDALHTRVAAYGVVIEEGLVDRDYGSREFTCRDPKGNLWCFGTYWPKTE